MITHAGIEEYFVSLLPPRDAVLAEMEEYAAEQRVPIVGPAVGQFLALLVSLSGARRVFELGSAIGYSTIWLARAAGERAEVHYSDGNPENARRARNYFARAGVAERIHIHTGDALAALASTAGEFDLVFNDVDKEGYPDVLRAVPPRLRQGGLFVTDNTLWHGRVLAPKEASDFGVVEFNRLLSRDSRFRTSLLPLRDGISVALKR